MPRFNRTYRLLVGDGAGVEIVPPIRCTFSLRRTLEESPNDYTVRVWNLANSTSKDMQKPDARVALYAGYAEEGEPLLIASGDVTFAYHYQRDADVITEISFKDGQIAVRDTVVTLGYGQGVKASAIIQDIAGQMGLPLVMAEKAPDRTWQNGFSFFGAAHTALHKVTRGTGLQWSIQDGQLQVLPEGESTPDTAFVLNASSGLLGSPRRTRKGAQDKTLVQDAKTGEQKTILQNRQELNGWRVESLLLPTLRPGDRVKLESETVQGWFKAHSVSHAGDSYAAGQWKTTTELVTI